MKVRQGYLDRGVIPTDALISMQCTVELGDDFMIQYRPIGHSGFQLRNFHEAGSTLLCQKYPQG